MGNWALPNKDVDGDIRSIHFRVAPKTAGEKARWFHEPKGAKVHALVFGELAKAGAIAIFESQWDAITLFDKLNFNPFACHDWAFVSTRGAANAKTLKELDIPVSAELYLFPQSDAAGTRRTDDVLDVLRREAFIVPIPVPHKDLGEWGLNGLDSVILLSSIQSAKLRRPAQTAPQQNVGPDPDFTDEELRQFDRDMRTASHQEPAVPGSNG
jgi:hypothetical protein